MGRWDRWAFRWQGWATAFALVHLATGHWWRCAIDVGVIALLAFELRSRRSV